MNERKEAVITAASEYQSTIKPYRLRNMMKTAAKIMDLLVMGDIGVNYDECLTVLDIVRESILAVKDKETADPRQ